MSKTTDNWNYISKLSPLKCLNLLKNIYSFLLAKLSINNNISGLPLGIAIEPTTSCNLRCTECPSGSNKLSRAAGMMPLESYKKIIDQLYKSLNYIIIYFQGEPYLNKDFFQFIRYAKEKNIYTYSSTNGHFLNDINAKNTILSGLDKLIVSIDGTDQKTYASYRKGGELDTVLSGIDNLIDWKKKLISHTPHIVIQFLVFKTNEHQIDEIKRIARQKGVELQLKSAQVYEYKKDTSLIPSIKKYSRYKKLANGNWALKTKLLNQCYRMWSSAVITWDGDVIPCCFDKDASIKFGNINKTNFNDIWHNYDYNSFRKKVFSNRKSIPICCNCTEE